MKKVLKGVGIVIGVFIIIGIIIGACGSGTTDDVSSSEQNQPSKDYEFVEEPKLINEGYGCYSIKGILKNNTNTDKEYVQISFVLYDKDGNNVGTALANATQLKAHGNWKFNATGGATDENTEVTSFELDSVDGF